MSVLSQTKIAPKDRKYLPKTYNERAQKIKAFSYYELVEIDLIIVMLERIKQYPLLEFWVYLIIELDIDGHIQSQFSDSWF
jgi:hypothetical protein